MYCDCAHVRQPEIERSAHHAVGLDVGGQRVDSVTHALLHQVHVAAQFAAVVRLAHVATVVVPAGALVGQLEQAVIFHHEYVYEEEKGEEEEEEEYQDMVNEDVCVGSGHCVGSMQTWMKSTC